MKSSDINTRSGRSAVIIALFSIVLSMLILSCVTPPSVEAPEGFAVYDRDRDFLAVSPEGVRFKLRYEKNDPEQDLEFWQEALELHMESSGYEKLAGDIFETVDGEGIYYEWVAPVGQEDWIYLTAVTIHGDLIAIAEAAGAFPTYRKYRQSLMASLESIRMP